MVTFLICDFFYALYIGYDSDAAIKSFLRFLQRFLRDETGPALPALELPLEVANRKCKVTVTNKVHKYVHAHLVALGVTNFCAC